MTIWSAEIKDLEKLFDSLKGRFPKLEKELEKLVKTDDENMVLVYARRCLEVLITDLSERELKRPRGTEPLKGIIDKLNKEEKVPQNIIASMQNLNNLSTFGAHPKDFDPRQVKPVLLDLITIIDWYHNYTKTLYKAEALTEADKYKQEESFGIREMSSGPGKKSSDYGQQYPESTKHYTGRGKPVTEYRKAGFRLKKRIILISGSILAFGVVLAGLAIFDIIKIGKKAQAGPIESLVVLPFDNFTGDDQLEYFVSGMHSSLITDIGKINGLRVICKTSSNAYKNANMSVHEIASELNVDAVIEADVMGLGDSIYVQFKLISALPDEKILWSGDFKEEKSHILQLYNRVTKKIANKVRIELTPQEEIRLTESKTVNTEAYDDYMKGQYYLDKFEVDALEKATEYFSSAIRKDPDWAPPYAGLAEVSSYQMQSSRVPPSIAIPKIYINLNRALELDPNSANSHYVKAVISVWTEWNWEKGEEEFIKAIELNPSHAPSRIFYSHLLMILHRPDEAVEQAKLALELDPMRPFILGLYGEVMANLGYYQDAIIQAKKAISIENHRFAFGTLQEAYYLLGDYEKSFDAWKRNAWWDDEVIASIEKVFREQGYFAAIEAIIKVNEEVERKGGQISVSGQARRCLKVKQYDKAMDYLEKGYAIHDPNMPYISVLPSRYPLFKNNQRFIELVKKMNLPLD